MLKLRVHIAPVGFEIDRVIEPLIRLKADKVWLIIEENIEDSDAKFYYKKIKARLDEVKIVTVEKRCDIRSLFDLLNIYRIIIEDESKNQVFINVSTGNKIQAIAGMMAAMIFNEESAEITPYYVIPENYDVKPSKGQQITSGYKDVFQLPNYKIERPKESHIAALNIINENNRTSKKVLIEKFLEKKLIVIENEGHTEAAKYSQLNKKYLEPLIQKGFIEIHGSGKAARIFISENGQNILKFLPG
jgi:hypothetical protein